MVPGSSRADPSHSTIVRGQRDALHHKQGEEGAGRKEGKYIENRKTEEKKWEEKTDDERLGNMRKKWELVQRPEIVKVPIGIEQHQEILAEIAQLLYQYFCSCQSHLDRFEQSRPLSPALARSPLPRGPHE